MYFTDILNASNEYSTLALVLVTIFYATSTHRILKEQRKEARRKEILYALENVYSPLINLIEIYVNKLNTCNVPEFNLDKFLSSELKMIDDEEVIGSIYRKRLSEFFGLYNEFERNYRHIFVLDDKLAWFIMNLKAKYSESEAYNCSSFMKVEQFVRDDIHNRLDKLHGHLISKLFEMSNEISGKKFMKNFGDSYEGDKNIETKSEHCNIFGKVKRYIKRVK